ncbi:hypothetical protein KG089_02745 [Carnobacteriaceae bacterium zg-ZUI252]|nr:hypothetical protein [Carnobacteriaceae bacterium zg-ZUI252]MBS4769947.1 hypothetical protein [Carnobacteriaceae bacterium zg-ZUI240]
MLNKLHELYRDHPEMPYISPERDVEAFLKKVPVKLVSKLYMTRLENGLLPGDIIILWRVNFGTFTTEMPYSKYFEYTYGIDGPARMKQLVKDGYVLLESVFDSLDHINSAQVKALLKQKQVTGLSKMKRDELDEALKLHYTEDELAHKITIRGYCLTEKGKQALKEGQWVVDKHPKKTF